MTADPDADPDAEDDPTVAGRFTAKVIDGHVTEIRCKCGWEIFAENPWIRGARGHAESGECEAL